MRELQKRWNEVWAADVAKIFGDAVPSTAEWTKPGKMIDVLQLIAGRDRNHMFLPSGGGLTIMAVSESNEAGCIELHAGAVTLVKPAVLSFNNVGGDPAWSYFRLDNHELKLSGVYEDHPDGIGREEVVELPSGDYISRDALDTGYYGNDENGDEVPLPKKSRLIERILRGPIVIFSKGSYYNQNKSTYDARHAKMSASEFGDYIARSAALVAGGG